MAHTRPVSETAHGGRKSFSGYALKAKEGDGHSSEHHLMERHHRSSLTKIRRLFSEAMRQRCLAMFKAAAVNSDVYRCVRWAPNEKGQYI